MTMIHPTVPGSYEVLHADQDGKLVPYHPPQIFYTYLDGDGKARWRHRVVGGEILGEGFLEKDPPIFDCINADGTQYATGSCEPLQMRVDTGSTWVNLKPL
jgi:hypothetical protein